MTTPIAYLPQHVAQVMGIALGLCFVSFGVLFLVRGVPPDLTGPFSPRFVRVFAWFVTLGGIAMGLAFFFIDAEHPNQRDGDHWGGPQGIGMMLVFLAFLGGIVVYNLRRYWEAERHSRKRRTTRL